MPSYSRFVELIPRQAMKMYMLLKVQSLMGQRTGTYFIDSKKLPVCHNRRIHSNKVFSGFAARGKSSTGWYYGLKVYLIINQLGEIVNFELTSANVPDNNAELLQEVFDGLKGTCYGDKGYLSKLFDYFIKMG
jgi:CRISPR/Cas system CMR-associated protein Cmr1 (group 7 of RAMP superfamily)